MLKTGSDDFMVIGLLPGEKHSFMHDLESFGGFFSGSVSIMMDLLLLLSCPGPKRGCGHGRTGWAQERRYRPWGAISLIRSVNISLTTANFLVFG